MMVKRDNQRRNLLAPHVRFGSLADIYSANCDVRFRRTACALCSRPRLGAALPPCVAHVPSSPLAAQLLGNVLGISCRISGR